MPAPTDDRLWGLIEGLLEPGEARAVQAQVHADPAVAARLARIAARRSEASSVGMASSTPALRVAPAPVLHAGAGASVQLTVPGAAGWRPVLVHVGDAATTVLHPTEPERFVALDVFPSTAEGRVLPVELPEDGVVEVILVPPDHAWEAPGPGAWAEARRACRAGALPGWFVGRGMA